MPELYIQRVTLTAGTATAIVPPITCHQVSVGNATAGDVQVLHQTADATQYVVIAAGFERDIHSEDGRNLFTPLLTAFYLNAVAGGTVVLQWL